MGEASPRLAFELELYFSPVKTLIRRLHELSDNVLFWDDADSKFDSDKEHTQNQNYYADLVLRKLKPSL